MTALCGGDAVAVAVAVVVAVSSARACVYFVCSVPRRASSPLMSSEQFKFSAEHVVKFAMGWALREIDWRD